MWWSEAEPGTWVGHGVRENYLAWYDTSDGLIKLTRWERRGAFEVHQVLEMREALSHMVSQKPVARFGGDPSVPDVEHALALTKMQADMFDSGTSLPELDRPDWVHSPTFELSDFLDKTEGA